MGYHNDKIWIGSIFLKNEGGFEVVMRALNHYNRRLHRISQSPEVGDAGAMFGSILQAESAKVIPQLKPIANRLRGGLCDDAVLADIQQDLPIIQKALVCYKADIQKASRDVHRYYTQLVQDNKHAKDDLEIIDDAIKKINGYYHK